LFGERCKHNTSISKLGQHFAASFFHLCSVFLQILIFQEEIREILDTSMDQDFLLSFYQKIRKTEKSKFLIFDSGSWIWSS
jgi:hypothetical protein